VVDAEQERIDRWPLKAQCNRFQDNFGHAPV
jgi:hypothetical protein